MLAASLDTLGLYARSADDLEMLCRAFRLEDDEPPTPKPVDRLRIGVCKTSAWSVDTATPALERAWTQAQDLLKAAGADLVECELRPDFDGLFDVCRKIMWCEARSAFLNEYLSGGDLCHADFIEHATNGKNFTRKEQLEAYDRVSRLKPVWDAIAEGYDVGGSVRILQPLTVAQAILTPSAPGEAPLGQASTGSGMTRKPLSGCGVNLSSALFCGTWTALQAPSLNVPGFCGEVSPD